MRSKSFSEEEFITLSVQRMRSYSARKPKDCLFLRARRPRKSIDSGNSNAEIEMKLSMYPPLPISGLRPEAQKENFPPTPPEHQPKHITINDKSEHPNGKKYLNTPFPDHERERSGVVTPESQMIPVACQTEIKKKNEIIYRRSARLARKKQSSLKRKRDHEIVSTSKRLKV